MLDADGLGGRTRELCPGLGVGDSSGEDDVAVGSGRVEVSTGGRVGSVVGAGGLVVVVVVESTVV